MTTYDLDVSGAWYAVSLLPRSSVIGHATMLLGAEWFQFVALLSVNLMIYHTLRDQARARTVREEIEQLANQVEQSVEQSRLDEAKALVDRVRQLMGERDSLRSAFKSRERQVSGCAWALLVLFIISMVITGGLSVAQVIVYAVVGMISLASVVVIAGIVLGQYSLTRRFLIGLAISYLGTLLIVVFDARLQDPPLPDIQLTYAAVGAPPFHIDGELVAHASGYWYLFSTENPALIAIPDNRVETVEITSEYPKPSIPPATPIAPTSTPVLDGTNAFQTDPVDTKN